MSLNINIPTIKAPTIGAGISAPQNLSLGAITKSTTSLTGLSVPTAFNVPTSTSGVASSLGINTNMSTGQAFQTLGVNPSLSGLGFNAQLPSIAGSLNLSSLKLPQIPQIPGLGPIGISLGAGPKFLAETLIKYKTIIPPFAPGLKINMAMAGAAISILKAVSGGNIGALATSLLEDLKESTGVSAIQDQVQSQVDQVQSQVDQVKEIAPLAGLESQYNNLQSSLQTTTQEASGEIQSATDITQASPTFLSNSSVTFSAPTGSSA